MDSTKLNEAVEYIWSTTLDPVDRNPTVPSKLVNQTKHAEKVIRTFNRIGDLVTYMSRFKPGDASTSGTKEMRDAGIPTFESIYDEFLERLGDHSTSTTRPKQTGNRYDKVYEKNGKVTYHRIIVTNSKDMTRLGNFSTLCSE